MTKKHPLKLQCPTCLKDVDWEASPARPFCSERCRLIDLGKWSDEAFRIKGEEINREEGEVHTFPQEET